jgi:hypothetical protein
MRQTCLDSHDAPYGLVENLQVALQELGPELVVVLDRGRRAVGGVSYP